MLTRITRKELSAMNLELLLSRTANAVACPNFPPKNKSKIVIFDKYSLRIIILERKLDDAPTSRLLIADMFVIRKNIANGKDANMK